MESRKEVTRRLSELVEKRITGRNMVWSREVPFDKGTSSERRVDYVAFRPFMPEQRVEPSSLELGTFEFYEIKSCIADFESGHGLTFEGDENYLVTVPDLAERLRVEHRIPDDCTAVLVPTSDWSRLRRAFGKIRTCITGASIEGARLVNCCSASSRDRTACWFHTASP